MIQTKDDVVTVLRKNQRKIRELGVKRLGLFGSFVRGEQSIDSDVDVLVEFEKGQKSFDHFMQLSFLLEEVLKRHVELLKPEALSPHIGPHILKEVKYVPLTT
ncbi:MAG: nucleotidyltransferase family protein [Nitrospiria bacterium]